MKYLVTFWDEIGSSDSLDIQAENPEKAAEVFLDNMESTEPDKSIDVAVVEKDSKKVFKVTIDAFLVMDYRYTVEDL